MDSRGIVLYVGSFSKVIASGLRVGWIVAPQVAIRHMTTVQQASCLSGNTLVHAAMARFCAGGQYESYLRRVHRVYRGRMRSMLRGLAEHLPRRIAWTKPSGGYTLWVTLPDESRTEHDLVEAFREAGVIVSAGRRFFARKRRTPHFRLSIACVEESRIDEGCRRLGSVLSARVG